MSFRPRFHSLLAIRDEGDIIAQSLEHQLKWADLIHVFDTGSTDDTWEIVNHFAQQYPARFHLVGRKPVYFNDTEVRSYLFAQSRSRMNAGDWVLRCDADEFHHIRPPDFVDRHMRWYETSAYHQYYDFQFTSDDLAAWNEGRETQADRARPIAERRRYYTVSQEHEPRMFRYRRGMHWPHNASFPINAGFVARNRLPIRHYPHRDPIQMEHRCKLHSTMLAYPPSNATWLEAHAHHWTVEDWTTLVPSADTATLHLWQPNASLPTPASQHLPTLGKRMLQLTAHLLVVPWFDQCRRQRSVGTPAALSDEVQCSLACPASCSTSE